MYIHELCVFTYIHIHIHIYTDISTKLYSEIQEKIYIHVLSMFKKTLLPKFKVMCEKKPVFLKKSIHDRKLKEKPNKKNIQRIHKNKSIHNNI